MPQLTFLNAQPWFVLDRFLDSGSYGATFFVTLKTTKDVVIMKNCDIDKADVKKARCTSANMVQKPSVRAVLKVPLLEDDREVPEVSNFWLERVRLNTAANLGLTTGAFHMCHRRADSAGVHGDLLAEYEHELIFMALIDGDGHRAVAEKVNFYPWAGFAQYYVESQDAQLDISQEREYAEQKKPGMFTIWQEFIHPKALYYKQNPSQPGLTEAISDALQLYKAEAVLRVRDSLQLFYTFLSFTAHFMSLNFRHCDYHQENRFFKYTRMSVSGAEGRKNIAKLAKGIVKGLHTLVDFPFTLLSGGEASVVEQLTKKIKTQKIKEVKLVAFDRRAMRLIDMAFAIHLEPDVIKKRGGLKQFGNLCRAQRGSIRSSDIMEALSSREQRQDWLFPGRMAPLFERIENNVIGVHILEIHPVHQQFGLQEVSVTMKGLEHTVIFETLKVNSGIKELDELGTWTQQLVARHNDLVYKVAEDNPFTKIIAEENVLHMKRIDEQGMPLNPGESLEFVPGANMTAETEIKSVLKSLAMVGHVIRQLDRDYFHNLKRLKGYQTYSPSLRKQRVVRKTHQ